MQTRVDGVSGLSSFYNFYLDIERKVSDSKKVLLIVDCIYYLVNNRYFTSILSKENISVLMLDNEGVLYKNYFAVRDRIDFILINNLFNSYVRDARTPDRIPDSFQKANVLYYLLSKNISRKYE